VQWSFYLPLWLALKFLHFPQAMYYSFDTIIKIHSHYFTTQNSKLFGLMKANCVHSKKMGGKCRFISVFKWLYKIRFEGFWHHGATDTNKWKPVFLERFESSLPVVDWSACVAVETDVWRTISVQFVEDLFRLTVESWQHGNIKTCSYSCALRHNSVSLSEYEMTFVAGSSRRQSLFISWRL